MCCCVQGTRVEKRVAKADQGSATREEDEQVAGRHLERRRRLRLPSQELEESK